MTTGAARHGLGWAALALLLAAAAFLVAPNVPAPTPSPLPTLPISADALLPVPPDNVLSTAKIELGRRLFFEPRLSGDGTVACATCHVPALGFSDGRRLPRGIGDRIGRRNTPSLVDCGYRARLLWDGRAGSLEQQALLPIENPDEMGSSIAAVVAMLRRDSSYAAAFAAAFGSGGVTPTRLAQALSSFERTLVGAPTPFDHAERSGRELGVAARRGRELFEGRAHCAFCHRGPAFSDARFHNTGVGWNEPQRDRGRYEFTARERDDGRFRTPTLRGLAHTPPYMHDGSLATLREVIDFYDRGGNPNPRLDPMMQPLELTAAQKADLLAFLRTLSATDPVWTPRGS